MSNYYTKYLKYKQKYNDLKNQNGGIITEPIKQCIPTGAYCGSCINPDDTNFIILNCGCCFHRECIIGYIKSALGNKSEFTENGIVCPLSKPLVDQCRKINGENSNMITYQDVEDFFTGKESIQGMLTREQIDNFNLFSMEKGVAYSIVQPEKESVSASVSVSVSVQSAILVS